MKPKMTPWFPPHIKPKHVGVYPAKFGKTVITRGYAMWSGTEWSHLSSTPTGPWFYGMYPRQDKSWRGFTEKQE